MQLIIHILINMKVRELIIKLLDYNLDADIKLDLFNNFDKLEDFMISYGGPGEGEGTTAKTTELVSIERLYSNKENG